MKINKRSCYWIVETILTVKSKTKLELALTVRKKKDLNIANYCAGEIKIIRSSWRKETSMIMLAFSSIRACYQNLSFNTKKSSNKEVH